MNRVDGPLKVTGAARYPADETYPDMVHAVLVPTAIPVGRITAIDSTAAEKVPGVLAVLTHRNVPQFPGVPPTSFGPSPLFPLADATIRHHGQYVAVVVAETRRQAAEAGRLLDIAYASGPAVMDLDDPAAEVLPNPYNFASTLGDVDRADFVYAETFSTVPQSPAPMGLFATVARWDDGKLTVHDATQWPLSMRSILSGFFGVPENDVRVLCRFVGGGFGSGLRVWPHTLLCALAARVTGRPVRVVLDRPQMFSGIGHRSESRQRLRIAADADGRLRAIDHDVTTAVGTDEPFISLIVSGTADAYDCPNVATHDRQVRLTIPNPGFVRAPGDAEFNFAMESAMDELASRLEIDPVELRLRNFRGIHQASGLPWASNALRECYRVGAERFGWQDRDPRPRSGRDGDVLVGQGMAGVSFHWYAGPCAARISIGADGGAVVRTAATDLGTGTATIVTQLAAEHLGLPVGGVRTEIGDTALPFSPQSGGSGLAMSVTGAVLAAAGELIEAFVRLVADDERSPLYGRTRAELAVTNGRLHLRDDVSVAEAYTSILARHGLPELEVETQHDPRAGFADSGLARSGAYAAHFVEVRVDEQLGTIRVARLVSAVDAGRVLNAMTARSQIIGGAVMGLGMALLEDLTFDGTGRVANGTFGDYLIPVSADVPDHDVTFVGEPDPLNPGGVKGIGEIGTVGIAAAIANAVHHATGIRVRSLPITIDKVL